MVYRSDHLRLCGGRKIARLIARRIARRIAPRIARRIACRGMVIDSILW